MGLGKLMLTLYTRRSDFVLNEIERKARLRSDVNPFQHNQRKTQAYR